MPKFTDAERRNIMNLVACLSIKIIPEPEIIKEVERQTNKTVSSAGT
jgi:hypothetical protein